MYILHRIARGETEIIINNSFIGIIIFYAGFFALADQNY